MLCYTHPNHQAIAICKNCSKGVCPLCAIEIEDGIACSEHCAKKVNMINGMINKNKNMPQRVKGSYYRTAFIYGAVACLFLYSAFLYPDAKTYMYAAFAVFGAGSLLTLYAAFKVKK